MNGHLNVKSRIINLPENIKVIIKYSILPQFVVLTEVCAKTAFFRCTVPCGLVNRYHLPEDGGSKVLRNRLYIRKLSSNKLNPNLFIRPQVV